MESKSIIGATIKKIKGGIHKSWAHGKKREMHSNLRDNVISWA
jgi:hypothetical protein